MLRHPIKEKFKRNPMCEPLTSSPSDKGLMFLKQLVSWVNKWENLDSNNGRLSKETFLSLNHTTQAFIEIVNHCTKSFKREYILLGKIQTNKLESRFGQYRSMAGDQYHISVRQIYETKSKLRLCHELKLASHKKGSITVDIFDNSEKNDEEKQTIDLIFCDIMVEESDIEKIADTLPIVTCLAGYCSHAAIKKTKCLYCRQKLITDKESISHDNYKLIDVKIGEAYYIQEYMRLNSKLSHLKLGIEWLRGFEKRWSTQLTKRKPELLTQSRAAALSADVVNSFFTTYIKLLDGNGLANWPQRIFNLDKAGLSTDPRANKLFISKQSRNAYSTPF
ncbi:hypothetical protein AVEN_86759-1 [Araneus ventricosus]|uniref:Uncharacterized protein n=1 Tax=Araneus ventricosus TaxID=182803 RepID=A0A4Y2UY22_ARAVE|nr:hypothetical protein AVEN_86759-1 [Araneus ventricosus]